MDTRTSRAKQNQFELPTFEELENPNSGSIEIFVDREGSIFCEENNVAISTNGIKINNLPNSINHTKYIDVMEKYDNKTVWVVEIPSWSGRRLLLNNKVLRYMKDVISRRKG